MPPKRLNDHVGQNRHYNYGCYRERKDAPSGTRETHVEYGSLQLKLDATGHKRDEQGGQQWPKRTAAASLSQNAVDQRDGQRRAVVESQMGHRSKQVHPSHRKNCVAAGEKILHSSHFPPMFKLPDA